MFHPNVGGVESHIFQLAQALMAQGHRVAVMTQSYPGGRCGVRYLTRGLRVYHVPMVTMGEAWKVPFPTVFGFTRLLRKVAARERATVVHCHQAFSTLGLECILSARALGYRVVFTDHSLLAFGTVGQSIMNKLVKFLLSDVHRVVCVSHVSRENIVLRACIPPSRVHVIPNAVDASRFRPDPAARPPLSPGGAVTVVCMSRLAPRKGADLLAAVIPAACARHPHLRFVVGGDGPKRPLLEATVRAHGLQDRVELLGAVLPADVPAVLARGHVFLNTSLTEAFCMAIVEAASCGLLVVSTGVGGVPEVLPPDVAELAEVDPASLLRGLDRALARAPAVDPAAQHARVRRFYEWGDVAARTAAVYDAAHGDPGEEGLLARLSRHYKGGVLAGKFFVACVLFMDALVRALEWVSPARLIEPAPDPGPLLRFSGGA